MPPDPDEDPELEDEGEVSSRSDDSPAAGLAALLRRHKDDANSAVTQLYDENYTLRKRVKKLRSQVKTATGAVPEGAVVLSGDELTQYNAYKQLGKPDEVRGKLDTIVRLEAEKATAQRTTAIAAAAQIARYKSDVLELALAPKNLGVEVVEEEKNGQKVKVAYVKDGETRKVLTEYAKDNWANLLPALQDASTNGNGGVVWPRQVNTQGEGAPDVVGQHLKATYQLPSQRGKK